MSPISNRAAGKKFNRFKTDLGMIWGLLASMVVLLIGTPVASAAQTATESVKSTIDEVIYILTVKS